MTQLQIWNRYTNKVEQELVYGGDSIEFLYTHAIGKKIVPFVSNRLISQIYGACQDSKWSAKKVAPFVKNFKIDMSEYQNGSLGSGKPFVESFRSFNDFFIREFKAGVRPYPTQANQMGAVAEGRYIGVEELGPDMSFPVKGDLIKPIDLLGNQYQDGCFEQGPLVIARLCPVDYHRYHYPDSGETEKSYIIPGAFYSVNPLALAFRPEIFIENERRVSILKTENFGKIAYIEVGATMVGKIIQSHDENEPFGRGKEKGYFLFGGSTVVLLGEKGKWKPSRDILENTLKQQETFVRLGDSIAEAL